MRSLRLEPAPAGPRGGVRGHRRPGQGAAGTGLQRGPDQGGLRGRRAPSVGRPWRQGGSRPRAPAPGAALGADPVLGQGTVDRQPDDQRPDGDRRGEAGVPPGLLVEALPAPGRRLLRVVPHLRAGQERQAAQAAVLHPAPRRRRAGDGGSLRDLARPHARRGRPRAVPLDVHRHHDRRRGRRRDDPRPDAPHGRAGPLVRLARPAPAQGLPARPADAGRAGRARGVPGLQGGRQRAQQRPGAGRAAGRGDDVEVDG